MSSTQAVLRSWSQDGRLYAVLAAAGFSMKAVFVKLGYAAAPVDALTLLALRMGFALPLFLWLAWLARDRAMPAHGVHQIPPFVDIRRFEAVPEPL